MKNELTEIMNNAESLKDNPTDFATLKIDGKSFILTTLEQLGCLASHSKTDNLIKEKQETKKCQ